MFRKYTEIYLYGFEQAKGIALFLCSIHLLPKIMRTQCGGRTCDSENIANDGETVALPFLKSLKDPP